jgi:hypothetical protein
MKIAVKEGVIDIQLVKGPPTSSGQGKETTDCDDLGSWGKGILIINTFQLSESLRY